MIDWIRTWTFFNWLAIIAFLMALVGFLNSFLSLRSRFKDWRGVQSKKAFAERLNELKHLVTKIGGFRKEPAKYFFIMTHSVLRLLMFFVAAFSTFTLLVFSTTLPVDNYSVGKVGSFVCLILLGWIIGTFIGILRTARYTAYPELIKKEVSHFLRSGAKRKLLSEEAGKDILETLFNQNLITVGEYDELEKLFKKIT